MTWKTGSRRKLGAVLLVLGALLILFSGPAFLVTEARENSPVFPAQTIPDADAAHAEQDAPAGTISGRTYDPNPRNHPSRAKWLAFFGILAGGICVFSGATLCIGRRRLVCPHCGLKTAEVPREVGRADPRPVE